jgi:diacylglycerol O-acyltransferase
MGKLSLIDDTFLRLESRRQPLHIGMLMLFEPPADAPPDFAARLAERLRQSTATVPPFNQRLERRRGLHYWVDDEEFDLAHHFVHTSLPRPGRIRELLALISRVHGGHLDRAYPLWRIYFIEGIEGGRIALYLKVHHAVVDGVAGIRLLVQSMSRDATESARMPPIWEVSTRKSATQPLPVPTPAAGGLVALRQVAREGIRSTLPVLRQARDALNQARKHDPDIALVGQAPPTILNRPISATRRFAAQQYSTPRMRAIAAACDATLNDVVLAMCGGALRRYLQSLDALPKKPLIAGVPVSVRRENTGFGNEVAFTITHLATHVADPVERLRAIKRCMDKSKQRMKDFNPVQVQSYAALMLMPGAIAALLSRFKDRTLGNVVVSHVPGPREDLYWQGAKLSGLYPASLLLDGLGLNITVISRHDFVDFGLIACRKTVPQVQRVLDYLEEELNALEAATIKPATPAKKGRTRSPRRKA